jgi:hypothetical protein
MSARQGRGQLGSQLHFVLAGVVEGGAEVGEGAEPCLGAQGRAGHIDRQCMVAKLSHQLGGVDSFLVAAGWAVAGQQSKGVLGWEDIEVDDLGEFVVAAAAGGKQGTGDWVGGEQGLDLGGVEAVGEVVDHP